MKILKTLNTLIFFVGVYLLFVGSFITKLEIECGIANIPCNAAVRLALLFIVGLLCLTGSFVLFTSLKKQSDDTSIELSKRKMYAVDNYESVVFMLNSISISIYGGSVWDV